MIHYYTEEVAGSAETGLNSPLLTFEVMLIGGNMIRNLIKYTITTDYIKRKDVNIFSVYEHEKKQVT